MLQPRSIIYIFIHFSTWDKSSVCVGAQCRKFTHCYLVTTHKLLPLRPNCWPETLSMHLLPKDKCKFTLKRKQFSRRQSADTSAGWILALITVFTRVSGRSQSGEITEGSRGETGGGVSLGVSWRLELVSNSTSGSGTQKAPNQPAAANPACVPAAAPRSPERPNGTFYCAVLPLGRNWGGGATLWFFCGLLAGRSSATVRLCFMF